MFSQIPITTINDFVFCPRSVYFHYEAYEMLAGLQYKAAPQRNGTLRHSASDEGRYSSRKRFLQGMEISSEKYGLVGKIDIYDSETKTLIERKARVKHIFPGYRWQVMAQMVCLEEMGFAVDRAVIHSLEDNKKYPQEFSVADWKEFLGVLGEMRSFDIAKTKPIVETQKCDRCIYRTLCRR